MKYKPCILARKDPIWQEEIDLSSKYFPVYNYRSDIPENSFVISRYSCLPFYEELEYDVKYKNSYLINSYEKHKWIANFEYYKQLKDYTFKTYSFEDLKKLPEDMEFVVKGCTNSLKQRWNTHMYANNKRRAIEIALELQYDALIGQQNIIFREYEPLEILEEGINGLKFANEWRFFFLGNKMLSHGYYWVQIDDIPEKIEKEGLTFAQKIANIACEHCNFFVLDVAKTEKGDWILVEINDGQMSGLSMNDPEELYKNLKDNLTC